VCFQQETGIVINNANFYGYPPWCNSDQSCKTQFFNASQPDVNYICGKMIANPSQNTNNFDTIFWSLLNIYQISTLENWSFIMNGI